MFLLDMTPPTGTATQFVGLDSKNKWGRKMDIGQKTFHFLELASVLADQRKTTIKFNISPDSIDGLKRMLAKDGLMLRILEKEPLSQNNNGYKHISENYVEGPFTYKIGIGKTAEDLDRLYEANKKRNDIEIGRCLGYPESSIKFYLEQVANRGYFDPVWQQAENTQKPLLKNRKDFTNAKGNIEKKLIRVRESEQEFYKISTALRYVGGRLVPFFPRSLDDVDSLKFANEWIQVARDAKADGVDDILDILRLPYEWSCNKGIAIVNTPVFKVVTGSVPCYPEHVIQQENSFYPEEALTGLKFPWKPFKEQKQEGLR